MLSSVSSLIGPLGLIVVCIVLAQLSRRLGAMSGRPPIYQVYYLAILCIVVALIYRLFNLNPDGTLTSAAVAVYDLLLFIGVGTAVLVSWRYWGWLLTERE